jgi:hypothetical protein
VAFMRSQEPLRIVVVETELVINDTYAAKELS